MSLRKKIEAVTPETELQGMCNLVHKCNKKWWVDIDTGAPIERDIPELVALVHSELSEALEGLRKGLSDDKLPQYDAYDVEVMDCVIRLMDFAGGFKYNTYPQPVKMIDSKSGALAHGHWLVSQVYQSYYLKDVKIATTLNDALNYVWYGLIEDEEYRLEVWKAKMLFNLDRADHKLENRRKDGGKKF